MVPLSSVATFRYGSGPVQVTRYNNYPAAELQGQTPPGVASGDSLRTMEELAAQNLPPGFAFEWTGLAFQQQAAGNTAPLVFAVAVLCVFMVLAAQYESLTLPLAVILIVPMCVLAAMTGVNLRGHGQQYPDPDRPDRADRARGQERDPDRRVRPPGRGRPWA